MPQILNKEMIDPTGQKIYVSGATPQDVSTAITAQSLAPTNPFNPVQPESTQIFPVAGLNAELTSLAPLPQETQQSDLIKQIQGLTMDTTGEAGFRAQQEQAQGIPELQKTQSDLSARLKAIQNEALAIPLQLQQEATGRGITEGGLRPIQTAALRNNAIQALSVSSLLEASRGNLMTAQSLADRAVAQKYDPIKAEITAKLANLELLSKDPTLTLAQKNRLEAQKARQEQKQAEAAQAEALYKEVQKIAVDAAGNAQNFIPTSQFRTLAQALQAMQQSDPQTALQIAASVGLTGTPEDPLDRQLKQLQIQKAQRDLGGAGGVAEPVISPYQQERQFRTIQSVNELRRTAVANPGIFGKTAAVPVPLFFRSDAFRNFRTELDTLKSSIAFGELTAMREASKTGGALGQVSDREGKLLESALGALDMTQSPENFVKQLDKINASITRWQNALASSAASGALITAPNGDIVEITD